MVTGMNTAHRPWRYLTQRRNDMGETITEFAERCDPPIGRPMLSLIESGARIGRVGTLKRIADRLGMSVIDLLATHPTYAEPPEHAENCPCYGRVCRCELSAA